MTGKGEMRRRLLCWVAIITVPVAGCGKSGTPTAHSSPSVQASPSIRPTGSPSPSPSRTGPLTTGAGVLPGEKPPVEPDLARQHTAIGAYQFAAYFIRALSWSIATLDPYLLETVSAPSCAACRRYVDGIAALRSKGEQQRGGRPVIKSAVIDTGKLNTSATYAIEFGLHESAAQILPTVRVTRPPTDFQSIVFVSWAGSEWRVVEQSAP
jgi:hypothetical protein